MNSPSGFLGLRWAVGSGDVSEVADEVGARLVDPSDYGEFDDRQVFLTADDEAWSVFEDLSADADLWATYNATF